jgi:hypothetical protein
MYSITYRGHEPDPARAGASGVQLQLGGTHNGKRDGQAEAGFRTSAGVSPDLVQIGSPRRFAGLFPLREP